ncbi:MAG: FtsX-like permease family protein [Gammaproteobacteria bacterium]|nr:FtsX-like permease family protein [Gammaproteobacteria bacterium]
MRIGNLFLMALRSIRRNKLRSFFMMLGVTLGVASLTALASVGEATRKQVMERFKNMLGTFDVVIVNPGRASTRGMPSVVTVPPVLDANDARAIESEVPLVKQVATVQFATDVEVTYRDRAESPSVMGISSNWAEVRGDDVAIGSGITAEDNESLARVAVIGVDLQKALFQDEDPLGKQVRIGDVPFQVKGIMKSRGVGPGGASMDNILFIPLETSAKRLFRRDYYTGMMAQLRDPSRAEQAIADITALMRERHGIVPPVEDDFTVTSPQAQVDRIVDVGSTLRKILTGVSFVATLIGGTVIMSLMLIAVRERHREIGVRRAVGASRGDILAQFLIEAVVISLVGGFAGIAIGVGGTLIVTTLASLPPTILWSAVAGAASLSAAVGLVFGLQPAWAATRVDPIQALRS